MRWMLFGIVVRPWQSRVVEASSSADTRQVSGMERRQHRILVAATSKLNDGCCGCYSYIERLFSSRKLASFWPGGLLYGQSFSWGGRLSATIWVYLKRALSPPRRRASHALTIKSANMQRDKSTTTQYQNNRSDFSGVACCK